MRFRSCRSVHRPKLGTITCPRTVAEVWNLVEGRRALHHETGDALCHQGTRHVEAYTATGADGQLLNIYVDLKCSVHLLLHMVGGEGWWC